MNALSPPALLAPKQPLVIYFATLVLSLSGLILSIFFLTTRSRLPRPRSAPAQERTQPGFGSAPEPVHFSPSSPAPTSPSTPRPRLRTAARAASSPELRPLAFQPSPTNLAGPAGPQRQKLACPRRALTALPFGSPRLRLAPSASALEKESKAGKGREKLSKASKGLRELKGRRGRGSISSFLSSSCESLSAASPSEAEDPAPPAQGQAIPFPFPHQPSGLGLGLGVEVGEGEESDNSPTPRASPVRRRQEGKGMFWLRKSGTLPTLPTPAARSQPPRAPFPPLPPPALPLPSLPTATAAVAGRSATPTSATITRERKSREQTHERRSSSGSSSARSTGSAPPPYTPSPVRLRPSKSGVAPQREEPGTPTLEKTPQGTSKPGGMVRRSSTLARLSGIFSHSHSPSAPAGSRSVLGLPALTSPEPMEEKGRGMRESRSLGGASTRGPKEMGAKREMGGRREKLGRHELMRSFERLVEKDVLDEKERERRGEEREERRPAMATEKERGSVRTMQEKREDGEGKSPRRWRLARLQAA
ncbi:hypothetical protein CALVIDRAFT_563847 [Calocera viscosa TUFC12733]|uniref:Uncharacterized protein n=1 Tax=Calocera viscosa (strain TUFC12733) TaxID=1330018 RepID=A0A167M5D9_CALVF|nr:hypothetical protein CALVIDRAFT_563847 [Calocera viscosa TUFC12733]